MKTLKDLTEPMIAKILETKAHALEGVSNGTRYENFCFEDAYKCVEWNYKKCGYRTPLIIVTENPLEMQMMFNFVKAIDSNSRFFDFESKYPELFAQLTEYQTNCNQTPFGIRLSSILRSKIGSRVHSNLDSNFLFKLDSQLYAQLYSKMFAQLEGELSPDLNSRLGNLLRSDLRTMLGDQLGHALDDRINMVLSEQTCGLEEKHLSYLFTINFYSDCIYAWFEFLRSSFNLDLSVNLDFQDCFKLQRASGISQAIFTEELCVISKYPKQVHWNKEHELHNRNSQAIEWSAFSDITKLECLFNNGQIALQQGKYFNVKRRDSKEEIETYRTSHKTNHEYHSSSSRIAYRKLARIWSENVK